MIFWVIIGQLIRWNRNRNQDGDRNEVDLVQPHAYARAIASALWIDALREETVQESEHGPDCLLSNSSTPF